jgi:hypothetical protein
MDKVWISVRKCAVSRHWSIADDPLLPLTSRSAIRQRALETLAIPTMPIQDAIDLARYLVEVTMGFTKFSIQKQPKTVGGAIEIAAITKHEGFRWIQRKQFYLGAAG